MKNIGLIIVLSLISTLTFAQTAEEKGLQIITEVDKRDIGFGDTKATLKMRLINRKGDESLRSLKITTLEVSGEGDKSLTVFSSPRDIKGTAFLSYTHALVADEQWLYLPALKRVKRISSRNKSGPFLGSEFAFEDLSSFEVAKFDYKTNTLYVVNNHDHPALYSNEFIVKETSWIAGIEPTMPLKCEVVIRYRHKPTKCRVKKLKEKSYLVKLEKPQRAVTPGQSAVFYNKNQVLGGGIIKR